MNLIALAEALALAGATPDMIVAALKSQEKDIEIKRASARARQRNHRSSYSNISIPVTVTSRDRSVTEETPPYPLDNTLKENPPKGGQKKNPSRGSRLTLESLPANWKNECLKLRPELDPADIFERFCDHWKGVPGQRGIKLDWFGTWRNWCKSQHNKSPPAKAWQKPQEVRENAGML